MRVNPRDRNFLKPSTASPVNELIGHQKGYPFISFSDFI